MNRNELLHSLARIFREEHPGCFEQPGCCLKAIGRPFVRTTVAVAMMLVAAASLAAADERQEALEERAFREATVLAAPSLVRIETVGGLDVVGELLTSSGPTTGVVVAPDGWIITSSFNFASKPASILVTTADGLRHPAKVVGADESRMLTLLKIDATGLSPLPATPQAEMEVGQWAIALGQTYEQPIPNVSVGIVSALGRIWGRAIQTDAKISPANYGGALIDVTGRGMGILVPLSPEESDTTAGVDWYDSGIGFAIPLEDVYAVLERLQEGETLKPGLMGVGFTDRSPISGAALLDRVRPGSPADEAGLQVGDTIVEFDGQPIARVPHLRHVLGRKYAGDVVSLKVKRDGETIESNMTLAAELTAYVRPLLGILPMRPAADGAAAAGVGVRLVLPASPAASVQIERGDRIISVNGTAISDADQLADVVSHFRAEDVLAVEIVRDGESREVEVTLGVMTGELPETLPTVEIPVPDSKPEAFPPTGRVVETLGGDDNQAYWAFVPTGYNPAYAYGLVVWLHPPGDTMEADVLAAWKSHCERRGLILLGPKTSAPSGWSPADAGFVERLVDAIRDRYSIDPTRIVMHATSGSAAMAAMIAFQRRQTYRGLSLVEAPLRVPPPETDPEAPLQFHFLFAEGTPLAEPMLRLIETLRKLAFPVTQQTLKGDQEGYPKAETIDGVARWIDALDRI